MDYSFIDSATCTSERGRSSPWRRVAGFTVVEMLAVVAIVGILAMVAAPSFSQLIANQRAGAIATDVFVALIDARSEAIKRNVDATTAPKAGGWAAGWQVTVLDANGNTVVVDDHSATTGIAITGPDNVVYQSSGRVQGNTAPCFTVTATQGSSVMQSWVTIDLSGRPLVRTTTCG